MPAERHVEHQIVPGKRLGKRPRDRSRDVMRLRDILTGTIPDHPLSIDYMSRVPQWILGRNSEFGTCGPTSLANHLLLTTTWLADAPITLTDDDIFDLYRRSGNPDFDPASGEGDNGVEMTVMLAEAVKNGVGPVRSDDTRLKPLAFALVDSTDPDETWAAASLFGATLWGADLTVAQQTQTVWDYDPTSPPWGGHATAAAAKYTDTPGTANDLTDQVTWQQDVAVTDAYQENQVKERYVVIWPWNVGTAQFRQGVDLAKLAAAYEALTGRPFPASPTPGPAPVPPGPTPVPDQPVVDMADRAFWAAVQPALTHLSHHGAARTVHDAITAWHKSKGF